MILLRIEMTDGHVVNLELEGGTDDDARVKTAGKKLADLMPGDDVWVMGKIKVVEDVMGDKWEQPTSQPSRVTAKPLAPGFLPIGSTPMRAGAANITRSRLSAKRR